MMSSNGRPSLSSQKRASEPTLSAGAFQEVSTAHRYPSLSGSEYPVSKSPLKIASGINLQSAMDPLGLTLIHCPDDPILDIIFVHGLGGTSFGTWSFEHNTDNFWPIWLGDDQELRKSRIFTFGYFSAFTNVQTTLNILDFAKDLLFRMRTFSSEGQMDNSPIGKVCDYFIFNWR